MPRIDYYLCMSLRKHSFAHDLSFIFVRLRLTARCEYIDSTYVFVLLLGSPLDDKF